jgi:hypothetical protein
MGALDRPPGSINPGEKKPFAIVRVTQDTACFGLTDSVEALGIDQPDLRRKTVTRFG